MDTEDSLIELTIRFSDNPYLLLTVNDVRAYCKTVSKRAMLKGEQKRNGLLSLNETDSDGETHVDIPSPIGMVGRYDTLKSIILHLARKQDGQPRQGVNRNHLRVFVLSYLSGHSQVDIASKINVSVDTVNRLRKRIDSLILSMPLRDNVGRGFEDSLRWTQGNGSPSPWATVQDENPSELISVSPDGYRPMQDNRPDYRESKHYPLHPLNPPIPSKVPSSFPVKGTDKGIAKEARYGMVYNPFRSHAATSEHTAMWPSKDKPRKPVNLDAFTDYQTSWHEPEAIEYVSEEHFKSIL